MGFQGKMFTFEEISDLDLKKTIIGKDKYIFLINDSNNEIKQHFDKKYTNKFNSDEFTKDYYIKKDYFKKQNISYFYFYVPDKAVLCKDFLPFDTSFLKRNVDKVEYLPNFSDKLDYTCYWKNDSHMNVKGAKLLSFYFLNYIDNSFNKSEFEHLIDECNLIECEDPSDLLSELNWSYSQNDKYFLEYSKIEVHVPKSVINLDVPERFSRSRSRLSEYLYNPNSFTDKKVLIFRDSATENLKYYLSLYFREIFLYWDHLNLNKKLIKWYQPDIIIEIRIEKFLEGYFTPNLIKELM